MAETIDISTTLVAETQKFKTDDEIISTLSQSNNFLICDKTYTETYDPVLKVYILSEQKVDESQPLTETRPVYVYNSYHSSIEKYQDKVYLRTSTGFNLFDNGDFVTCMSYTDLSKSHGGKAYIGYFESYDPDVAKSLEVELKEQLDSDRIEIVSQTKKLPQLQKNIHEVLVEMNRHIEFEGGSGSYESMIATKHHLNSVKNCIENLECYLDAFTS